MEHVENSNRMQTLQVYKKVEKPSAELRVKRMLEEIDVIKKEHVWPGHEKVQPIEEEKRIKSIEFQNTLIRMEKVFASWVIDYRRLIDEIREYDRIIPKNDHQSDESDRKAQENVQKIIRVEKIKDDCLADLKEFFMRFEDTTAESKSKIRKLEIELVDNQRRVEDLEFQVKRLQKKH